MITNVEAEPNGDGGRIAELLRRQVTAPVRFTEMIERLVSLGTTRLLEVGPGRVLTGLTARIAPSLERSNLASWDELSAAAAFVAGADR